MSRKAKKEVVKRGHWTDCRECISSYCEGCDFISFIGNRPIHFWNNPNKKQYVGWL